MLITCNKFEKTSCIKECKNSIQNIHTCARNVINDYPMEPPKAQYNNGLYFCDSWERKRHKDVLSNVGLIAYKVTSTVSCT